MPEAEGALLYKTACCSGAGWALLAWRSPLLTPSPHSLHLTVPKASVVEHPLKTICPVILTNSKWSFKNNYFYEKQGWLKRKCTIQSILCICCLIRKFAFTKLHFMSQENDTLSFTNIPSCSQHPSPPLKDRSAHSHREGSSFNGVFLILKDQTFISWTDLKVPLASQTWWQTQRCLKLHFYPVLMSYLSVKFTV